MTKLDLRQSYEGRILSNPGVVQIPYLITLLSPAMVRQNYADEVCQAELAADGSSRFLLGGTKTRHQMRERLETWQRITDELDPVLKGCVPHAFCNRCANCFLFGSLGAVGPHRVNYSLYHRVRTVDAMSIGHALNIVQRTRNQVDPATRSTGTAMTTNYLVPDNTVYYGCVTLTDPTEDALRVVLNVMRSMSVIGASTSVYGACELEVLGLRHCMQEEAKLSAPRVVANRTAEDIEAVRTHVKSLCNGDPADYFIDIVSPSAKEITALVARYNKDVTAVIQGVSADLGRANKIRDKILAACDKAETVAPADRKKSFDGVVKILKSALSAKFLTGVRSAFEVGESGEELTALVTGFAAALKEDGVDEVPLPDTLKDLLVSTRGIFGVEAPDIAAMEV